MEHDIAAMHTAAEEFAPDSSLVNRASELQQRDGMICTGSKQNHTESNIPRSDAPLLLEDMVIAHEHEMNPQNSTDDCGLEPITQPPKRSWSNYLADTDEETPSGVRNEDMAANRAMSGKRISRNDEVFEQASSRVFSVQNAGRGHGQSLDNGASSTASLSSTADDVELDGFPRGPIDIDGDAAYINPSLWKRMTDTQREKARACWSQGLVYRMPTTITQKFKGLRWIGHPVRVVNNTREMTEEL